MTHGQTDRHTHTHTQTHRQAQTDFIICPIAICYSYSYGTDNKNFCKFLVKHAPDEMKFYIKLYSDTSIHSYCCFFYKLIPNSNDKLTLAAKICTRKLSWHRKLARVMVKGTTCLTSMRLIVCFSAAFEWHLSAFVSALMYLYHWDPANNCVT